MKTLYLVRHAKSSWAEENQPDIERPLNDRGQRVAPKMGKLLAKEEVSPKLWISSPAVRARTTAEIFAKEMGRKTDKIVIDDVLYSASESSIIKMLERQDEDIKSIILFFHNPTVSHIASFLTGEGYEFPTCAVLGVEIMHDSWKGLVSGCARQVLYEYPKKYDW